MSIPAMKDVDLQLPEHELGLRETVDEAAKDAKKAFEIYREVKISLREKIQDPRAHTPSASTLRIKGIKGTVLIFRPLKIAAV